MIEIIKKIEQHGYDWLVRSNKAPPEPANLPYFANITIGSSVRGDGSKNPRFESYPSYGMTAEEALQSAARLWSIHNKIDLF